LDIIKTPIIVAVEVFVFSTVYYDGSISKIISGGLFMDTRAWELQLTAA